MRAIFRRHPRALPFLFLTEMWERFGFYVVQGLLVLYMTQDFHFSDDQSYTILGVFSALAYIAPMIGGLLADRLLGFKKSIIWGGLFLSIGYAYLALSNTNQFYYALAIIIVGNGLFKPNISSLLGLLYPPADMGRDAGFTIFYMGINIGVLLAGLSSGFIKNHFGWHAGFALSSVGLLIGLSIFILGILKGAIHYKDDLINHKNIFLKPFALILYCIAAIPVLSLFLRSAFAGKWLLPAVGIFLLIYLFYLSMSQPNQKDRNRLITLIILIVSAIVFWMMFLQMFFSTNLFIDRLINKNIFGMTIPTTVFYTFESIFVIILGPFFASTWQTLNANNQNPSALFKFVLAIFFVALAFATLGLSTYFIDSAQLISPLWIVLSYFFLTVGEMLLSPIGLSAVTLLSPAHLTGMMMGIWFVALGFGGEFAGALAKLSSIPENMTNALAQLSIYRYAFFIYALIALIVAIGLFGVQLIVKKTIKE